jgi:hypothetical protein
MTTSPTYSPTSPQYSPTSPQYSSGPPNTAVGAFPRPSKRNRDLFEGYLELDYGYSSARSQMDENEVKNGRVSHDAYQRIVQRELRILQRSVESGNFVDAALVRLALKAPNILRGVEDCEHKIYTATTNVVWIDDATMRACGMSMREASGVAAFISSMLGDKKFKDYMDGPYLCARTGEDIAPSDENEIHGILRGLGFRKVDIPENQFTAERWWRSLHQTHKVYGTTKDNEPDEALSNVFKVQRHSVWELAVLEWAGEVPKEDRGK